MNEPSAGLLRPSIERYYRDVLGLPDWKDRTASRLKRDYETYMFKQVQQLFGNLEEKTLLDLGCGWGGVILDVAQLTKNAIGIEPDLERVTIANRLLREKLAANAMVVCGKGEVLPLQAGSFDLVCSYQVLEHVRDLDLVFEEISRVLKKGGVFHFATPNYMSFREPHYKVFWLPLLPKVIARYYLQLLGRDPSFIAHINYVNPISIRRYLKRHSFAYQDILNDRAVFRLKQAIRGILPDIPIVHSIYRALSPLLNAIVFILYACFINREQEFIARKR